MALKARKPKKKLVQGVVAAVVALVVIGVLGLVVVIVMTSVFSTTEEEKARVLQEAEEKAEEVERLRRINKELQRTQTKQEVKALVLIQPNTQITRSMVGMVEVQESTPGAITQLDAVVGKRAINAIGEHETITYAKLASPEGLPRVPVGMRAITIAMSEVSALNKKLIPGAYVDIMSTIDTGDEVITKTLMQHIQIIAVQSTKDRGDTGNYSGNDENMWSVTVAVTPEQSEILALANLQGKFHLALRNSEDLDRDPMPGIDVAQLLSGSKPDELVRELPNPFGDNAESLGDIFVSDPGTFAEDELPELTGPSRTPGIGHQIEIYRGGTSETKTFGGGGSEGEAGGGFSGFDGF